MKNHHNSFTNTPSANPHCKTERVRKLSAAAAVRGGKGPSLWAEWVSRTVSPKTAILPKTQSRKTHKNCWRLGCGFGCAVRRVDNLEKFHCGRKPCWEKRFSSYCSFLLDTFLLEHPSTGVKINTQRWSVYSFKCLLGGLLTNRYRCCHCCLQFMQSFFSFKCCLKSAGLIRTSLLLLLVYQTRLYFVWVY